MRRARLKNLERLPKLEPGDVVIPDPFQARERRRRETVNRLLPRLTIHSPIAGALLRWGGFDVR